CYSYYIVFIIFGVIIDAATAVVNIARDDNVIAVINAAIHNRDGVITNVGIIIIDIVAVSRALSRIFLASPNYFFDPFTVIVLFIALVHCLRIEIKEKLFVL